MLKKSSIARRHGFALIATSPALLAAALTLATAATAHAAPVPVFWIPGSTDFNSTNSWSTTQGGPSPATPTDNATTFDGAATSNQPNLSASISVASVNFGNKTTDNAASGYVISADPGATLTVTGSINGNNTSGINTISANLTLGAATNGSVTLSQIQGGTLAITGNIGQTVNNGLKLAHVSSPTFTFLLSGNNTFSGPVSFANTGAVLDINSTTALGTGTLTATVTTVTATIDNTTGNPITLTNNNAITLGTTGGASGLTFLGNNDLNFGNGAVTLSNANQVIAVNGSTLTLNGAISDGGAALGISKTGLGRLVLGGTSSFTGATSVTNGVLTVNGSLGIGGVSVTQATSANTSTLAGTGGSITGPVTIAAISGTKVSQISPGDGLTAGSIGQLSFGNNLDIEGGAILDLNKSGASRTNDEFLFTASGALTLGAANKLALNFAGDAPSNGDTWTIASGFGSLTGTFNTPTVTGLPAGDTYAINYNANSITVTVTAPAPAPEPASLAMLGLGGLALLKRRRSRL